MCRYDLIGCERVDPRHAERVTGRIGITLYQAAALIVLARLGRCSCKALCRHLRPQMGQRQPIWGRGRAPGVPVYLHPQLRVMEVLGLISSRATGSGPWGEWMWQLEDKGRLIVMEAAADGDDMGNQSSPAKAQVSRPQEAQSANL